MKWKRAVFCWFNCQVAFRRLCLLRHISGQVRLGSWIISFGLRGPSPQAFTPFRGGLGSLPGAWGAPNKGNADGARAFLANSGRVWATALRPVPPKKRPCAIHARKVGRASNTAVFCWFWWLLRIWRWMNGYILYCWMGRQMWLARSP